MNRDNEWWVHPSTGNLMTPRVCLSYCNLQTPRQVNGKGDFHHSVTLLIPASVDMAVYIQIWQEECAKAMSSGKFPAGKFNPQTGQQEAWFGMTNPLKECRADAKMQEPFFQQFNYYVRTRTYDDQPPGIALPTGVKLLTVDNGEVYSGRWAVCSLQPFAYEAQGNYGISFGIQNVQLLQHGERLGGGRADVLSEFSTRSDIDAGQRPPSDTDAAAVAGAPPGIPSTGAPVPGAPPATPTLTPVGQPQAPGTPPPQPAAQPQPVPGTPPPMHNPQAQAAAQAQAPLQPPAPMGAVLNDDVPFAPNR